MASVSKTAFLTGTASAALAAALPGAPAQAQTTLPVGMYQWTGYYAGLQAGGVWTDEDSGDAGDCGPFSNLISGSGEVIAEDVDDTLCVTGTPVSGPNQGAAFPTFLLGFGESENDDYVAYTGNGDSSGTQGLGGAFFGYNVQTGPFVFGFEADASGVFGDDSEQDVTFDYFDFIEPTGENTGDLTGYFGSGTVTNATNLDWLTTIRGRAGMAIGPTGRLFLYGTGGLAIGHFSTDISGVFEDPTGEALSCDDCTFTASSSEDETRVGGVLGAGAEFGITGNMRVGLQYLWTHFGSQSPSTITFVGDGGNQFDVNVGGGSVNIHTVTARFSWAIGLP